LVTFTMGINPVAREALSGEPSGVSRRAGLCRFVESRYYKGGP